MTGKELKIYIKGTGLTIEEAAKKVGMSRQTLSAHFGKAKISDSLEQKIKLTLHNVSAELHNANFIQTESVENSEQVEDVDYRAKYIKTLESRAEYLQQSIIERNKAFEMLAEQSKALINMLTNKIDEVSVNLERLAAQNRALAIKSDVIQIFLANHFARLENTTPASLIDEGGKIAIDLMKAASMTAEGSF